MDIDQILKELEMISGSRKRTSGIVKDYLKQARDYAINGNLNAANTIAQLVQAYCLFLIEEKLEALNKTLLYISKKDGA